eukprot:jgi/Psemu1/70364/estExt_Genemark1.C_19010002
MSQLKDNLAGQDQLAKLIENADATDGLHHVDVGVSDIVVGLFFSLFVLGCGVYMSHMYSVGEREEIAAAERSRLEAEKIKIREMESYRVKIANVLERYTIRLTNITSSRSLLSPSRHNHNYEIDDNNDNNDNRTVPSGSDDEEHENPSNNNNNNNNNRLTSSNPPLGSEDNNEDIGDIEDIEGNWEIKTDDTEIPTSIDLTVRDPPLSSLSEEDPQSPPIISPSSSSLSLSSSATSSARTRTRSNLRDAVTYNPCMICLDHFRPGDVIVCCSNKMNGQRPHVFHQECSLDYVLSHNDGMKAPCPCCKRSLLPPESERNESLRHCQHSVLTLPELCSSDSLGDGETDEDASSLTEE